jgi:hypothetical protein
MVQNHDKCELLFDRKITRDTQTLVLSVKNRNKQFVLELIKMFYESVQRIILVFSKI